MGWDIKTSLEFLIGVSKMETPGAQNRQRDGGLFPGKPVFYFAHTRRYNAGSQRPKKGHKKTHKLTGWEPSLVKVF
ncbi:hypothetical protein HMPREF0326_01799 [Desulfovibrio sp. 3_1_syn3]|uniref:hypothetical protein n=1 Tax=Desulfovibrio sp. 3_1_syn3 TaxID=457398 RepID=UPI00038F9F37|nr:hypothetical protein [Desulfovibrio sp. 3_1_syn3]EFL86096.2 hypothetical protein HMPREF0326_01799 [Desulfovibrio sp. 3_1_syn3]